MVSELKAVAPAKVNLTLEVLGKRGDGYHEVRSVMQTIGILDEVSLGASEDLRLEVEGDHLASDDDLVLKAVRTMEETHGLRPQGRLMLRKRIPAGAGLGGGSSDAAAAMRLVDRRHGLAETAEGLAKVAARFSSDGPFFCYGGTALVSGRGEIVSPLPDAAAGRWFVVVTPPHSIAEKTKRLYGALEEVDFTDGRRSEEVARRLRDGGAVEAEDLCNAFDRAALRMFDGLDGCRRRILEAGARTVHLAGSGPALFTMAESEEEAQGVVQRLAAPDCTVQMGRGLRAEEATAVVETGG